MHFFCIVILSECTCCYGLSEDADPATAADTPAADTDKDLLKPESSADITSDTEGRWHHDRGHHSNVD